MILGRRAFSISSAVAARGDAPPRSARPVPATFRVRGAGRAGLCDSLCAGYEACSGFPGSCHQGRRRDLLEEPLHLGSDRTRPANAAPGRSPRRHKPPWPAKTPNFSAYAASKAAVIRLTETIADEVRPFNIQVNAIAPGAINTRMLDEVFAAGDAAGEVALSQAKRQKQGGGDSLDMVVNLAVFLASDESDALTGKLISAHMTRGGSGRARRKSLMPPPFTPFAVWIPSRLSP